MPEFLRYVQLPARLLPPSATVPRESDELGSPDPTYPPEDHLFGEVSGGRDLTLRR